MSQIPPDRRDDLLHDLYTDKTGSALPSRMAARVRSRRRLRQATTACAFVALLGIGLFQASPRAPRHTPALAAAKISADTPTNLPASALATDADLMAALAHESVMVFTLADGQRQVVWLDGSPRL